MPEERAFTRRQAGVNPIALELDRLAEQRALQTLGARRPPVLGAGGGSNDDPRLSPADADPRTWNYAPAEQLSPAAQELAGTWDVAPGEFDAAMQRAVTPFQYDPSDPQWGGLEEDQAYGLWADRLAEVAKRYPDMNDVEREAFRRAFAPQ